jgi:hypothetical protein
MRGHRRIGLVAAGAALAISTLGAGAASAAAPVHDGWTNSYDGPALECPDFVAYGSWEFRHELTLTLGSSGNPTSDIERLTFNGRFYNPETNVSVADRGTKRFMDTFAADGSYAATIMTFQRTNAYVHEAGRVVLGAQDEWGDQAELSVVGHLGFNDTTIAAMCAALGQ